MYETATQLPALVICKQILRPPARVIFILCNLRQLQRDLYRKHSLLLKNLHYKKKPLELSGNRNLLFL